jgi:hypothetical protein
VRDGSNRRERARRRGLLGQGRWGGGDCGSDSSVSAPVSRSEREARGMEVGALGVLLARKNGGTGKIFGPVAVGALLTMDQHVEKWGQYGAATRWRVTWGPSAVLGWCYRPAAARPRWEQAARACGRHKTGERRGLTGGPHYSPGQHGQCGVKLFKLFSNLNSSKTFKLFQMLTDPNLTFSSSKNLE